MLSEQEFGVPSARRVPDYLMTTTAAASYLGLTRQTLRRWKLEHKGPPALRIGKRYYYTREMIDQWLKALSLA